MKKIKDIFQIIKSDYRHWICIGIILSCVVLIPFCFKYAHLRIWESFVDLKNSFLYYFNELFNLNITGDLTVNNLTKQPFEIPFHLPRTWEDFKNTTSNYWSTFFNKEIFSAYLSVIGNIFFYISKTIIILLPIVTIFIVISQILGSKQNNDYNKNSKPLNIYLKTRVKVWFPVRYWICQFIEFVKRNKYYVHIFLFIWAYNFNLIAIFVSFIAYYLFFICSFKTVTLYIQVLKLLMDLSVVPLFFKICFFFYCFLKFRKYVGYNRLDHMELMDRGFINERPIVLMVCGTMGKKKTTMITDMALSQEIMFRNKAFEMLLECDLKFPNFPWINLENAIKIAMKKHIIYNLATCRKYINHLRACFYAFWDIDPNYFKSIKRHLKKAYGYQCSTLIFDYAVGNFPLEYDNKLYITNLWSVLEEYTQLYFLYIIQSSLLISNYSIRSDNILQDNGNFPLWNTDLFKRDSRFIDAYARHSHILDFDALRLGKNIIEENEKANFFEFGVVNITEIGKERGNSIENQTIKKNDSSCNQKNDLFNSWLKMVRHSATIGNFPFVKIIVDEQRPESWGADARDLCEIVNIDECSKMNLSLPFFFFEDLICNILINRFSRKYYQYRYDRGDNTLRMYLYHNFISRLDMYHNGIYNTFGHYNLKLRVEAGTQDGDSKKSKYYLMCKKIYSRRFSTDCFSDFFNEKALKSKIGINDLIEFKTEKASFEEMMLENSYFFNDLINLKNKI